jgi:hypothetical protein
LALTLPRCIPFPWKYLRRTIPTCVPRPRPITPTQTSYLVVLILSCHFSTTPIELSGRPTNEGHYPLSRQAFDGLHCALTHTTVPRPTAGQREKPLRLEGLGGAEKRRMVRKAGVGQSGYGLIVLQNRTARGLLPCPHILRSSKSNGQHPRACGPGPRRCSRTSPSVQPASSSASARIGNRSKARSS